MRLCTTLVYHSLNIRPSPLCPWKHNGPHAHKCIVLKVLKTRPNIAKVKKKRVESESISAAQTSGRCAAASQTGRM